jgi:hypothetical protein
MSKLLHVRGLRDAYRFAGFVPGATVRGVFGKPLVRLLTLSRRQKKRSVAFVNFGAGVFTIKSLVWSATCPVADTNSIWSCLCAG